jgi:glutathione S-transferase
MIAGDHAILTHLATREPTRPGVDVLRGGSRLAQLDGLLACWREYRKRDYEKKLFDTGLETWEQAIQDQHYLGGTILGVDDCSLWPIVREMAQTQDGFAAQFPHLHQYYQRVGKRGIVRVILEETRLDG